MSQQLDSQQGFFEPKLDEATNLHRIVDLPFPIIDGSRFLLILLVLLFLLLFAAAKSLATKNE